MVQWAKENAASSGIADKPVRWLVDDCVKFVQREIRRGNRYDGIIMDPPSYGRGPGGEVWKLEEQLYSLVEPCANRFSQTIRCFSFSIPIQQVFHLRLWNISRCCLKSVLAVRFQARKSDFMSQNQDDTSLRKYSYLGKVSYNKLIEVKNIFYKFLPMRRTPK